MSPFAKRAISPAVPAVADSAEKEKSPTHDLEKIILRAQKGEKEAFSEIVDLMQNQLYRFCLYLTGNPQFAHDLTQDTLIRVLEKIETVKDGSGFKSWMYRVAKNLFIDHQRSLKVSQETEFHEEAPGALDLSQPKAPNDLSLQVREIFAKLEPEDRMVLLLIDMEGYSYQEAGQLIGITENAVRSRLHRARKEFMRRYEKP